MSDPAHWCHSIYSSGHEAPKELVDLARRNLAFQPVRLVAFVGGSFELETGEGLILQLFLHDEGRIAAARSLLAGGVGTAKVRYAPVYGLLEVEAETETDAGFSQEVFHVATVPECQKFQLGGVCHPNARGHRAIMHKHMWMHNHGFPGFEKADFLYARGLEVAVFVRGYGLVIGWIHDPEVVADYRRSATSERGAYFLYRPGGRELTCHVGNRVSMVNLAESDAVCLLDIGLARKYAATGTVFRRARPGEATGRAPKDPFDVPIGDISSR